MKLCPDCDPRAICCDHCANYDFNADSEGRYTGAGWCRLHQRSEDPGSECDDYECFRLNISGVAEQRPVPVLAPETEALFAGIESSESFTIAGAKKTLAVINTDAMPPAHLHRSNPNKD